MKTLEYEHPFLWHRRAAPSWGSLTGIWSTIHEIPQSNALPRFTPLVQHHSSSSDHSTPRTRAGGGGLDLELETSEPAAQTALDIALGRGHGAFATALRAAIAAAASSGTSGGGGGGGGASSSAAGSAAVPPSASLAALSSGSAAMKTPVDAAGKLCSICYCDDHDAGSKGVGCDEDHFICEECFVGYVTSESDTVSSGTLCWFPLKLMSSSCLRVGGCGLACQRVFYSACSPLLPATARNNNTQQHTTTAITSQAQPQQLHQ